MGSDASTAHFADKRFKQLAKSGALQMKGENYLLEIELNRGKCMVNGLTREQFMAALAGSTGARSPAIAAAPNSGR